MIKKITICILFYATVSLQGSPRPNIIFFLADDQRDDTLGCAGDPIVKTPTIDKLAEQGIRFSNTFCQVPICAASRATLFTGLTQRTHGFNFKERPVHKKYIETSYPKVLKEGGYRIGFAGKYGMRFETPGLKKHFDYFKHINRDPYLKKMPNGTLRHETDLCADAAIQFIRSTPRDAPFCLSISFNATHAEDNDRRPGHHFQWPSSANGLYADVTFPEPKLADNKYFKSMPEFLQDPQGLLRERFYWRWDSPEKYQANMRAYYRMISGIDLAIARVIKVLQNKSLYDNTILIYSADNGFMRGDRGTAGKWNPYEQSLRVPLIVYDPRLPEEKRGRTVDELVSTLDLPASFVDMAKLKIPLNYQGRSILPLMYDDSSVNWRETLFTEHKFYRFNNWHAVRGKRFKYIDYYDEAEASYEYLYDLQKDPNEFTNLVGNPEYAQVLKQMKDQLSQHLSAYPLSTQK